MLYLEFIKEGDQYMTIREIEEKTGMTRANVRYYEREGLLSPVRGANNYRDYSEGDLAALKKIQLLRQLRVPVAEIVRLKNGEVSLDTVLASQSAELEREARELDGAAQLCRALWEAHPTYDGLDAETWLNRSVPGAASAWKSDDVLFVAPHPWRRWFANGLDYALMVLILFYIQLLVLRLPGSGESGLFVRWLRQVIVTFFAGAAEALLLCTIGTTPGKWILGLRVRQRDGSKLSFSQAGYRAVQRFKYGEGYLIPLVDLWRNWVSYKACVNEEVLPWDEGIAYSCTPHKRRPLLCIPVALLCIAGIFLMAAQSILPVHQGLLTKEAFVENCETYARQHTDYYRDKYLDDSLVWRTMENSNTISIDFGGESTLKDVPYELTTDADGHITAVHIEYESHEDEGLIGNFNGTVSILRTAYVLASNRENAFSCLFGDDLWKGLDWMGDFTLTDGCVRVSHEIEYRGYEYLESKGLLLRDDSKSNIEAPYFRWSLTLTRIQDAS